MAEWPKEDLSARLTRELARAEAPGELWARVRSGRAPARQVRNGRPVVVLAAAAMLLATAGAIWLWGGNSSRQGPAMAGTKASCYACHATL